MFLDDLFTLVGGKAGMKMFKGFIERMEGLGLIENMFEGYKIMDAGKHRLDLLKKEIFLLEEKESRDRLTFQFSKTGLEWAKWAAILTAIGLVYQIAKDFIENLSCH